MEKTLPVLYLRGLSAGDFQPALKGLLGVGSWCGRSLEEVDYVYVWVDGIHLNVRQVLEMAGPVGSTAHLEVSATFEDGLGEVTIMKDLAERRQRLVGGEIVWPLEVRSRMRRIEWSRMIVIYDRFPLRGIDPSGVPSLVRRILRRLTAILHRILIPNPDVVLFLDGDAEVLWPRKKEYPLELFLETQRHYRQVFASLAYERHVIRTDRPLEESVGDLIGVLAASPAFRRKLYLDGSGSSLDGRR